MFKATGVDKQADLPAYQPAADSAGQTAAPGVREDAMQLVLQLARMLPSMLAPLVPVAVLCAGMYVSSIEAGGGRAVDKQHCGCACWDGRFKGRHNVGGYKSVYFNLEPTTAFLVAWTAIWVHLLGDSMNRIWTLFTAGRLSYAALVPALFAFYPMFYGAWCVWNYYNDGFHTMLRSQLFFQVTELLSAYFIYQLLDKQSHKTLPALIATLGLAISTAHVVIALKEGVLWGLFWPGAHTVNGRDVMLMAGDFTCLLFFGRLLHSYRLKPRDRRQLLPWGLGVTIVLVVLYIAVLGYKPQ